MDLTRERALELHRQMWTDMQKELGDNPTGGDRVIYKEEWCLKHFPNEHIANDCFLCEYAYNNYILYCNNCPIKWIGKDCCSKEGWKIMSISKLLALPEREFDEVN